jgi:hypothetical protein
VKFAIFALAATALFASAQSAHALTKWQKEFQAVVTAADIEDIAKLTGDAASSHLPNGKLVPFSRAKIYVRLAVLAINAKTTSTTDPKFSAANHQDEIAETVAYVIGKIAPDPKLAKVKKTPTLGVQVRAIIKEALKNGGALTTGYITDVVGSASQSVKNAPGQVGNVTAIQVYLTKFANKTSILGTRANAQNPAFAQAVQTGLLEGFGNNAAAKYEDGNPGPSGGTPGGASLITTADPETDFRPA